ncbi:MAG: TspO/MBR family protein [Candidatus Nanohaloarchaea archaeon]|nr:TspO/MBR family protein [Candidatus Nanohaloarchaea archaeon]
MLEDLFQDVDRRKLAVSLALPYAAGIIGGFLTQTTVNTWYPTLVKPWFNPPDILFRIVWPVLYTLMGIALYDVWNRGLESRTGRVAVYLFGLQLFLNAAWSGAFFTLKSPSVGLAVIVALFGTLIATVYYFYQISRRAAWLLVPYLLWTSYAVLLNASIWAMN